MAIMLGIFSVFVALLLTSKDWIFFIYWFSQRCWIVGQHCELSFMSRK